MISSLIPGEIKHSSEKIGIKTIQKSPLSGADLVCVKREINILKICQHPKVIRMLDYFENYDTIYIVTEWLNAIDLRSFFEKNKNKMPERMICSIVYQIAEALSYFHKFGIALRNLKLENIILLDNKEDCEIKLMNFELARLIGPNQLTTEKTICYGYAAPEILAYLPYDKAVDMWSLGVITYVLITGVNPFQGENTTT